MERTARIPQEAYEAGARLKGDPYIGTMLDEMTNYMDRCAGYYPEESAELPMPEPDKGPALHLGWVATVVSGEHVLPRRYYAQIIERADGDDVPETQKTVQYDSESGRLTGIIGDKGEYITDTDVLVQIIEQIHDEFVSVCKTK